MKYTFRNKHWRISILIEKTITVSLNDKYGIAMFAISETKDELLEDLGDSKKLLKNNKVASRWFNRVVWEKILKFEN